MNLHRLFHWFTACWAVVPQEQVLLLKAEGAPLTVNLWRCAVCGKQRVRSSQ